MTRSRVLITNILILIIYILSFTTVFGQNTDNEKQQYPYQDSLLSIQERVNDLLSRMSLEEKIRQMDMYNAVSFTKNKSFLKEKADSLFGELGAGSMHVRGFQSNTVQLCNETQKYVIEHSRWGIPILFIEEALHGAFTSGSTVFPVPLALASTWNPDLVESAGQVIATESRAHGVAMGLGPVLGIAREPRWGRVEETYGEDPFLVGEMGLAMVKGLQGSDLTSNRSIIAEPKHFAVHSQPEAGANCMAVFTDKREARSSFLVPFEKAFRKGKARAVMSAYSEWNGIPCTANEWLLTDLLRDEWGFKGFVLSDLGAINQLHTTHHIADSPKDAIRQAVTAGVDMQFYDFSNELFQNSLIELVNGQKLPITTIDRAVSEILRLKFELGLFERPYSDANLALQRNHTKIHQMVALQTAHEAICLLKNDKQLLPLKKNIKKIAVLGPNSNDKSLTGGYSRPNAEVMTVLEGIKKIAGPEISILHENAIPVVMKGVAVSAEFLWLPDLSEQGLHGEYFNNPELSGEPALIRIDKQVDFNWGAEAPAKNLNKDAYTIRWTGYLIPPEDFTGWFGTSSDDGSRLYIDDKLVVDSWSNGTVISKHQMPFKANQKYKIKLEYREDAWDAKVSLRWDYKAYKIEKAKQLAEKSDLAIVVLGENEAIVGENRDRTSLDLYGSQLKFVQEIHETGTPVVVVLINGRPISTPWISENIPAVIEAWFPGEQGGLAIADVLFGEYNPAGRLPITIPRSVGQSPIYYNQKAWMHHRNVDETDKPLYHFGHGLSYSEFEYNNLKLSSSELKANDLLKISLDVKNTGHFDGDEVVQLYVNDLVSSVTTPNIELKAFKRIRIKSGQTVPVYLNIKIADLALWNKDMKQVVEPGKFKIMIGSSSKDIRLNTEILIVE